MTSGRLSLREITGTLLRIGRIMLLIGVVFVQNSTAAGPLKVYTVNYPLKYFAERIGGE